MPTPSNVPASGLQLQSTLASDGTLTIALAEAPVRVPNPQEVVVRVEAAPINPSDLMTMFASADISQARFVEKAKAGAVSLHLPPGTARARAGRVGVPLQVGLEGAGVIVAAGQSAGLSAGQRVALLTMPAGTFAQYVTVAGAACLPIPDSFTVRDCAALFVNPMTALAIAETARLEEQTALLHTAAASNLGQMLLKVCLEDGLTLINIVRRPEQEAQLRALGARYVCDSSAATFHEDLVRAVDETGARIAFDAIGGGASAHLILRAIEAVAAAKLTSASPYGSMERKQVYVYGHLDPSPLQLQQEHYGMQWGVDAWSMPAIFARVGAERSQVLRQRIMAGATTTFSSRYTREITLVEAVSPGVMASYSRQATGQKFLICPQR